MKCTHAWEQKQVCYSSSHFTVCPASFKAQRVNQQKYIVIQMEIACKRRVNHNDLKRRGKGLNGGRAKVQMWVTPSFRSRLNHCQHRFQSFQKDFARLILVRVPLGCTWCRHDDSFKEYCISLALLKALQIMGVFLKGSWTGANSSRWIGIQSLHWIKYM